MLTAEMKRYEYEIGPTGQISYASPSDYHDDGVDARRVGLPQVRRGAGENVEVGGRQRSEGDYVGVTSEVTEFRTRRGVKNTGHRICEPFHRCLVPMARSLDQGNCLFVVLARSLIAHRHNVF